MLIRWRRRSCWKLRRSRGAAEGKPGRFGPAEVADGPRATQSAADMQDAVAAAVDASVVAAAGFAGNEDRAKAGQANLAAVVVSGKHEIEVVASGPGELVR